MKYTTDDGNISHQSSSGAGAAISTTQYPSSYHKQFLPGPEDVLQGSPTLSAYLQLLMIFFMCRLPMKTMHLHTSSLKEIVILLICQGKSLNVKCNGLVCSKMVQG